MARTTTLALLFLAVTLPAAPAARAEVATWDQEKVTAIAGELAEATKDLRGALRRQPPATLGQPGRHAFFVFRDEVGAIQSAARRLHNALGEGASREETYPIYRRLIRSVRNAAEQLPRIPTQKPVASKIDVVADVLDRLQSFYEEEPPI